jgi:gliotoxin biosynthesis N-methyltransferase
MRTQTENELHEAKARYYLPNSWGEIDRMRNQHEWVKGCAGGLIKAPIDYAANGFRVMDSATADGKLILPCDTSLLMNDCC